MISCVEIAVIPNAEEKRPGIIEKDITKEDMGRKVNAAVDAAATAGEISELRKKRSTN